MGNLISSTHKIYTFEDHPAIKQQNFVQTKQIENLPSNIDGKILMPISKIKNYRKFIWKHHHQVILLQKQLELGHISVQFFRGIPFINGNNLTKNPEICLQLHFDCLYCPIPMILQRFHQSYISNYLNSFQFYGLKALVYDKVKEYFASNCHHPFLICSNYELQHMYDVFQNRERKEIKNSKLTILCFCNTTSYEMSKKTKIFLQQEIIQVKFFSNLLEIIDVIKRSRLNMPLGIQNDSQKVYFYLSERQKTYDQVLKIARKLQRNIRDIKISKVLNSNTLLSRLQTNNFSIVIVSNDSKEMKSCLELYEMIEESGLQDRVIFIKRDSQYSEQLKSNVLKVEQKLKYIKISIFQKQLIFYGSLQFFKYVLTNFPHLNFKKFIETKDKDLIKKYICISTQVVITNIKLCACNKQEFNFVECQVIYIRSKLNMAKSNDKYELKSCPKQRWFVDQEEILEYFSTNSQQRAIWTLDYRYFNKKMNHLCKMLSDIFSKLREKNTILYDQITSSVLFFSCQYYIIDQMSNYIMKYFSNKVFGNYEQLCLFNHIKQKLYKQLISIHNCRCISQQVWEEIQNDESMDIYQFSENIITIIAHNLDFLDEINDIWGLFLNRDRGEHLMNCPVLFFLLFLGFNRTNFLQYNDQTLQHLTIAISSGTLLQDSQNFSTFMSKNRSNILYNIDFLYCEVVQSDRKPLQNEIFIQLEGNELTSFNIYMPIWKKGNIVIIPPLTKFEINIKKNSNYLLRMPINSQHKLLQKFSQIFFSENSKQLRLFQEEREMRKFDFFLQSLSASKYENAGYMLKKINKQQIFKNQDLLNAFSILYYLKKKKFSAAQQRMRKDKYSEILSRVMQLFKVGDIQTNEDKFLINEFSSSKRIQDDNKQYQILDSNSNENDSNNASMANSDPSMIQQLTNQLKLLKRSPSDNQKPIQKAKLLSRKIPMVFKKLEPSISDSISYNDKEQEPKIMVSPPTQNGSLKNQDEVKGLDTRMRSQTFGNNFFNFEPVTPSFQAFKNQHQKMNIKIQKNSQVFQSPKEHNQLMDPMVGKNSKYKLSQFFKHETERSQDFSFLSDKNQETGQFLAQSQLSENLKQDQPKEQRRIEQDLQIIEPSEEFDDAEKDSEIPSSRASKRQSQNNHFFQFNIPNNQTKQKRFPIKHRDIQALSKSQVRKKLRLNNSKNNSGISSKINYQKYSHQQSDKQNISFVNFSKRKVGQLFSLNNSKNIIQPHSKISLSVSKSFNQNKCELIENKNELLFSIEDESVDELYGVESISSIQLSESPKEIFLESFGKGNFSKQTHKS